MDKLPFEEETTGGREYIPPDYSEVITPDDEDDDDDDDYDLDMDDEEEEDPAELEQELEEQKRETLKTHPLSQQQSTFINPQPKPIMSTSPWPTPGSTTPGTSWGNSGQTSFGQWNPTPGSQSMPWGQKSPTWPSGTTPGWGNNSVTAQKEVLNRRKRVIICDVLDCLVTTLDGPQKTGLIPRGIWDVYNRLDVWSALRRFTNIERIYAMIPRSLIINSSGTDSWAAFLNYEACALGEFLRIPTSCIQILTQRHISQSKYDMIKTITENIEKEDIVYIGLQSGHPGQNSADIDCANNLGIDYIDLQHFLVLYS